MQKRERRERNEIQGGDENKKRLHEGLFLKRRLESEKKTKDRGRKKEDRYQFVPTQAYRYTNIHKNTN